MRGPVPKRSSQRRRANKPDGPPPKSGKDSGKAAWVAYASRIGIDVPSDATRSDVMDLVAGASADVEWHPLAAEWFSSLAESGQQEFYQPSDWATARVLADLLSRALKSGKVTAALVERWQVGATELLTTEGARRRMRLELVREASDEDEETAGDVSELDDYRRRRGAS